jgi:hypothetical protein
VSISALALETEAQDPPTEWRERHWHDLADKKLPRVYFNDKIAVYWSEDIKSKTIPNAKRDFLTKVWTYITKTYGQFGNDSRLHVVCHEVEGKVGWYGGSYMHEQYDNKNVISVIFTSGIWSGDFWESNWIDLVLAMAPIVGDAYGGVEGDPTERIWKKTWTRIFAYDVFKGMGDEKRAKEVNDRYSNELPEWYGKWFSKIWKQNFLKEYFQLLVQYWPKERGANFPRYSRELTFGEYLHFTSGALKRDLIDEYKNAFDWDEETEEELKGAKSEFRQVRY